MHSLCFFLCFAVLPLAAQPPGTNYDEAKVPRYTLPDPLRFESGAVVRDARTWAQQRRPEILRLLEREMFGRSAPKPEKLDFELVSVERNALGGRAIRKEVDIRVAGRAFRLLLYVPAGAKTPPPVFLGLNFQGNHATVNDPGVSLPILWGRKPEIPPQRAEDKTRGTTAGRWQVEKVLARGYALATIYYCEIEPDFAGGLPHGVRSAYLRPGQTEFGADEWGAIGAWAWGLSRAADYLETDKDIDSRRIALLGHSRLGKTALWAGAVDSRFGIVISNNSGEGGAAISRRVFGETVKNLNTAFPHWFAANYRRYNDKESEMPFDAHFLIALSAPRPVYIASAEEDQWADSKGEFLAAVAASPVWELFGKKGIGTPSMPPVHQPVGDFVRYHIRAGKHDVTAYDWDQFLDFADRHFQR